MADALQKAGVALVVENLSKFLKDMKLSTAGLLVFKAGLEKIKPQAGLLEKAFVSLGNKIKYFAQNILQKILVIAFGVLVRDAIRKVIDIIGEMVGAIVDATNEFQALEIRLNTFNLNTLIESGLSYNEAMEKSIALTKEQLDWTIKLAKASPYDATDVATGYSLARSYGFVDEKAQSLTDAVLNFASGMGLNNVAIERIITNLGQMVQQGKITGTELRDLARGSFVPVNKILGMVADNLGITTEELNKMRKAGTTDPQWFIDAFIQLSETDFAGASERMSRTLGKALGNLKDLFVGLPALKTLKPIFDSIGAGVSNLVEAFDDAPGGKFDQLSAVFARIGKAVSDIVNRIFGLLPSSASLADSIIKGFEKIAVWLEQNRGAIVEWVKSAMDFMKRLGESIKNDVLPAFERFGKWFYENKDTIISTLLFIAKAWLAWQVGIMVIRLLIGAVISFIGWLVVFMAKWKALTWIIEGVLAVLSLLVPGWGQVIAVIASVIAVLSLLTWAVKNWTTIKEWFRDTIEKIKGYFTNFDWSSLGTTIINGIINGIMWAAQGLFNIITWLANSAINLWNSIFQISSPSKVMFDIGVNITQGMAKGIVSGAKAVLGVTSKLATAVADTLSGTQATGGSITAGVNTSKTSNYLSNTGEVMRSKLDTEAGTDPCAPGTPAGCAAEKIGGALGGIGSSLLDALKGFGEEITEIVRGYATEDLKAASEYYDKGKEELQRRIDEMTAGLKTSEKINNYIKGLGNNTHDLKNRVKEFSDSIRGGVEATTKVADYATEDLKGKSAFFSTSVEEIMRLNNQRATTASEVFIARVIETNAVAELTLLNNSAAVIGFIQALVAAAIAKINSISSSTSNTDVGAQTSSTFIDSTTNVTNNFGKGSSKGTQVTFDYESKKFWV